MKRRVGSSNFFGESLSRAIVPIVLLAVAGLPALTLAQESQPGADQAAENVKTIKINPNRSLGELEAAYQKEYAFLDAQIRDLQKRLDEFKASAAEDERKGQAAIDQVESAYVALQDKGDRLNRLLTEAEREARAVEDSQDVLEATFAQAGATLEPFDIQAVRTAEYLSSGDEERLTTLLDATLDLLGQLGQMREEAGFFFLADGTEVNGKLLHIGRIASYGVSDQGSGALAPAGDGKFKIWAESKPDTALALASEKKPSNPGVFLYESSQRAIEEKAGKTVVGVIDSGGAIAWIIVGLGLVAVLLILWRFFFLKRASAAAGTVIADVGNLLHQGNLDEALKLTKNHKGATARVVGSALRNIDRDREHIEDIISEQILHESAHLNRFGSIIMVIAAVSPLLGLLGTVTGMISTFDIITEFGTGDPKLLSGGISIALVTTEVGLAVAIPALIFGNLLSGWAESIKDDMEKAALHVINIYKGLGLTRAV